MHSNEPEVVAFLKFEVKSKERREAIALIRNQCQLLHNSNEEYHKGKIQVSWQSTKGVVKTSLSLEVCANCNGQYSFKSIRNHKCIVKLSTPSSSVERRMKFLHCNLKNKSDRMRLDILPSYNRSEFRDIILDDELILLFGEYKCRKLVDSHHNPHIKIQMTYAAKILHASRQQDETIRDLRSLLNCDKYNIIYRSIRSIAQWDETTKEFKHPAVATTLTTLVVEIANRLEVEIIKAELPHEVSCYKLEQIKRFQSLITKGVATDINK
ncbi:hypothetical protein TKK_0015606 [Trichogramma kaykai]